MSEPVLERQRTGWDVALGVLLAIGGLVVMGHAVLATAVSVLFIGWTTLVFGVVGLASSLFRIGKGGFWQTVLTGGLLTVLGLVMLRHPGAAAVTLTLVAGAMFLTGGIVRLMLAGALSEQRVVLAISGVASLVLGVIVLFNLITASFTLLGVLLGVEMLADGITLMLLGRLRFSPQMTNPGHRLAT